MRATIVLSTGVLMMLAGCGGDGAPRKAEPQPAQAGVAAFDTHLPMKELMAHVVQHAGDEVWKWQGVEIDKTGEHSLFPKTDAEWEEAESGALTLAEITNLLLLPGRRVQQAGWDKSVADVRAVALKAAAAAETHDKDAFFAAGSALNGACDSCHSRYDPTYQAPPS